MHRLFQSKPAVHSDGSGTARVAVNYTHSATDLANVRDSDCSRICVLPFLPYRVYLHLLALYYAVTHAFAESFKFFVLLQFAQLYW